ncbi:hypothetical protein [Flagellimonas allohymeniacidonis]|uniref:Lipoprotein n=1 Tax=Flagellimonas allohymeniacidonis TaxID=2517819 RepID=A0A4Q8QF69_9FLAO|nr:hypothetical protein [Allomuricauda hymeniacidonis]TAI48494.1 hypothetical protein EW142_01430 [Allomuricauda hymeniacidonis]
MRNLILLLSFLAVLLGCKDNKKNKESPVLEERQANTEEVEVAKQKPVAYGPMDSELVDLIKEIVNDYPIKKVEETPENVHQSYYVSFFKVGSDTLLALCRQPYFFEGFPDYAFAKNETPKEKPEYVGMVEDADMPIFIFDSDGVGNCFYKNAPLVKEYPEKYLTDEGKSHAPEIPPIYKYKVQNGNFKFLGKSKSQWID